MAQPMWLTWGLKGFADKLCPVPMLPILSDCFADKEVLVTGLTLLTLVVGEYIEPVGITEGFQVDPPLKKTLKV